MNDQDRKAMTPYRPGIDPSPDQIRELVAKAGLSQTKAAAAVGVNSRTFRNYCSGKWAIPDDRMKRLEKLAAGG